jgi:hypothetical protein
MEDLSEVGWNYKWGTSPRSNGIGTLSTNGGPLRGQMELGPYLQMEDLSEVLYNLND